MVPFPHSTRPDLLAKIPPQQPTQYPESRSPTPRCRPAAGHPARRRRTPFAIDAPVVLDAEVAREPRGVARRAPGARHGDAPAAGGAALPGAGHAVPLALVGAGRAGGLLPGLQVLKRRRGDEGTAASAGGGGAV